MKNTGKKWKKNKQRKTRKRLPIIKIVRGGAWYSYFLPFFGKPDTKPGDNPPTEIKKPVIAEENPKQTKIEENPKQPEPKTSEKEENPKQPEPKTSEKKEEAEEKPSKTEEKSSKTKEKPSKTEDKPTKKSKYELKSDQTMIDKEFYENPDIMNSFNTDPNYDKVGIVHVTAVVGINVIRSYSTTVVNVLGKKGIIDENMHQLRNEMFLEMENVMKEKNIDRIENVQVAFTKDSGTLILNGFGTALRKTQPQTQPQI
jgi:type IV secretory pathway VirB10-like protein